jgi:mannose-6-phosphate isomerase-like protein (cupin superfamily)
MKATINKVKVDDEFYTDEKCYITELSNSDDDPAVSIARARVKAGVTTHWHRLKGTSERYCIISGRGRVDIDGLSPQEVTTGDTVLIPPMCQQRISNIGTDDLVFLAICSPRFTDDVYEDTEDKRRHR